MVSSQDSVCVPDCSLYGISGKKNRRFLEGILGDLSAARSWWLSPVPFTTKFLTEFLNFDTSVSATMDCRKACRMECRTDLGIRLS